MPTTTITVTIKGPNLTKWMDNVSQRQIPFATAMALSNTAAIIGQKMAGTAKSKWTIRAAWSGRAQRGRIGATDLPANAAFASTQVHRKTPIYKMRVSVGTNSWMVSQQGARASSERTPQTVTVNGRRGRRITYLAIPINVGRYAAGRLRKNAQHLLNNPDSTRSFVITGSGGNKILCQRHGGRAGKSNRTDYEALFLLVRSQKITPRFSMERIVHQNVHRVFEREFTKAMKYAIATNKPGL